MKYYSSRKSLFLKQPDTKGTDGYSLKKFIILSCLIWTKISSCWLVHTWIPWSDEGPGVWDDKQGETEADGLDIDELDD